MRRVTFPLTGCRTAAHRGPAEAHLAPALVLTLAITGLASAQQAANRPSSDRDLIQQLLRRVAELEGQVRELQASQPQTAATIASAPTPSPPKQAEPVKTETSTTPQEKVITHSQQATVQSGKEQETAQLVSHEHTMEIPGGGP